MRWKKQTGKAVPGLKIDKRKVGRPKKIPKDITKIRSTSTYLDKKNEWLFFELLY